MSQTVHQSHSGGHSSGGHSGGGGSNGGNHAPGGDSGSDGGIELVSTNPTIDLELSDLLKSESSSGCGDCGDESSFTGVGDVSLGVTAPTVIGLGASGDDAGAGGSGGGLLSGLC